MSVRIIAVGQIKHQHPLVAIMNDYLRRISYPITIDEIDIRKKLSGAELKNAEGEALLNAAKDDFIIALDAGGKVYDSEAFAKLLEGWRGGHKSIAFLIGGADGHADAVKTRADMLLSLGAMTWPHMLVRAMLLEQLYRAQCIAQGHPYHK